MDDFTEKDMEGALKPVSMINRTEKAKENLRKVLSYFTKNRLKRFIQLLTISKIVEAALWMLYRRD